MSQATPERPVDLGRFVTSGPVTHTTGSERLEWIYVAPTQSSPTQLKQNVLSLSVAGADLIRLAETRKPPQQWFEDTTDPFTAPE